MDKIYPEEHIQAIANAIRRKNGRTVNYLTSEMAGAIDQLESYPEPTGTQTITENGIVDVKDKAYADVNVAGSTAVLISKTITANGEYDAEDDEADGYSDVTVNVPNSYVAADEGKVVDNGALVAQGSQTITQNGTYDTTLISELIANISGGGGGIQKDFLYEFNESQGSRWIDTEVSVADIEALCFDDVRSDDWQKSTILRVSDIAVYTGGADVYTPIYTQTKPMNARIYNGNLWVSYNGTGAATNVTKIYSYISDDVNTGE